MGDIGGSSEMQQRSGGNQMNIQRPPSRPSLNIPHRPTSQDKKCASKQQQHFESLPISDHKLTDFLRANLDSLDSLGGLGALGNLQGLGNANKDLLALHNGAWSVDSDKGSRSSSSNSEGEAMGFL